MNQPIVRTVGRGFGRLLPRRWRLRVSAARARALSARTRHELRRMAAGGRPIIAGPWFGEVGFELLYWIPFLAWFAERHGVDPGRVMAVSRGGAASWYAHLAAQYCDVFEIVEPSEFRRRNEARANVLGEQKQVASTAFDEEIVAAAKARVGAQVEYLHPSMMYALFAPFWWGHMPLAWIDAHTRYRRLAPPPLPPALSLPPAFTAVKFYFNDCFEDTAATRAFVHDAVLGVTREQPVVSLSTGLSLDDHGACEPHGAEAVTRPGYEARTNLDVQSAIVARARGFLGTYGGFSYLPLFFGVPATAYFSDPQGYSQRHLDVARLAIERMGGGAPFTVRQAGSADAALREGGLACSMR